MIRTLLLALCLTGCASLPVAAPIAAPPLPALDSAIARPCDPPTTLPDHATADHVVALMARERAALRDCADRQAAAVATYESVRKALGGGLTQ
jgi:hypothetical protein